MMHNKATNHRTTGRRGRSQGRSRSRTRSRSRSRSRDRKPHLRGVDSDLRGGRGVRTRERTRSSSRTRAYKNLKNDDNPVGNFSREEIELFVGNLTSPDVTEDMLKDFLNLAMKESKLTAANAPDPIVACRLSHRYGFIEFANLEDCTKGLNLNGIPFLGSLLRIKRPARYEGPVLEGMTWQELTGDTFIPPEALSYPSENQRRFHQSNSSSRGVQLEDEGFMQAQSVILQSVSSSTKPFSSYYYATKSLRELFIGNITEQMTNDAVREFLGGALQKMGMSDSGLENPIQDIKITGKFAFIVCRTAEDAANMLNLNGIPFLNQALKIERPSKFDGGIAGVTHYVWSDLYSLWCSGELKLMTAGPPTRVLRITNMATAQELLDDNYYLDLIQETRLECSQFGMVKAVIIPRISQSSSTNLINEQDVGKVFVEMTTLTEAKNVLLSIKGRTFNGRCVDVKFYPEDKFRSFNYSFESPGIIITSSLGAALKEQVLTPAALAKLESA